MRGGFSVTPIVPVYFVSTMCQVEEDYQPKLERTDVHGVSRKCVKCKEELAAVLIRAGDPYCRSCFRGYFTHKFRAMLGKTRLIFPGEKVLLAVSGGPSSSAMLSQVQQKNKSFGNRLEDEEILGLSLSAQKKLRFLPGIVHIDEGGALGLSLGERQRLVSELKAIFTASGFLFYTVPLEQVLDLPSSTVNTAPSADPPASDSFKGVVDGGGLQQGGGLPDPSVSEPQTHSLQQLLGSAATLTAREDLLCTLRQHLLVHVARTRGYSKLLLGESCSRLAVRLLTCVSLGRGAHLAQDTGFSDSRFGDVVFVRPMREFSAKEISMYNHMFRVQTVVIPTLDTKMGEKASIQRLSQSFISRLQQDFPSTVSTVYRTSEKLQTAGGGSVEDGRCLLCVCSMDTAPGKASALQARRISEQLCSQEPAERVKVGPTPPPGQCCSSAGGECRRPAGGVVCCSSEAPEKKDLQKLLCYSCQLTLRDMSSVAHLPQYILVEAERRKRRSLMKDEISEFLLEEEEESSSSSDI